MYYIAKNYSGYALVNNIPRPRTINHAYHFTEREYKIRKSIYKAIGFTFYKVLNDGSRIEMP